MTEEEVTKYIFSAANGDELARERLIKHYKPFIINTVGHICKRYITWSDEEASIGLIAFNHSIDTYDIHSRKSFLNYVYLLIKRELIDYFRREKKVVHVPIEVASDDDSFVNVYELEQSIDSYLRSMQQMELVEEIIELSNVLRDYGIHFEELEQFSPKHHKTKKQLHIIAENIVQSPNLLDKFSKNKRLPTTALSKNFGHRIKTMERHRKYIVTLVILQLHPEWRQLSEYIKVPQGNEGRK